MSSVPLAIMLLVSSLPDGQPRFDLPLSGDLDEFEGRWYGVGFETGGAVAGLKGDVNIAHGRWSADDPRIPQDARINLHRAKPHNCIDFHVRVKGRETTLLGVYSIDGDYLTIHVVGEGMPRPTRFGATHRHPGALVILKRYNQ